MNTPPLVQQLEELYSTFKTALKQAHTTQEIEAVRQRFIGRSGSLTLKAKEIKQLTLEQKQQYGERINQIRQDATAQHELKIAALTEQTPSAPFDVTAYVPNQSRGSLHPYSIIMAEIENIAISMGLEIVQGPEAETEFHNFEALNIPQDHPARETQDTIWLTLPGRVLRSHTSTVQIRTLQERRPPFAILSQGRVYRNEATDASHDYMFMQCELMLVDTHVSLANLLALCHQFLNAIFNRTDLDLRTRPGFFPFVEPGIEIDFRCPFCTSGCSTCKKSTWIELGGAGLVHPNVLMACGINPNEYKGCAFGFGLTRLAMLKYGISDIRLLHSNSLSFLQQFSR